MNRTCKTRNNDSFAAFTPLMAWQMAAPHTWPAAILPVLVSCILGGVATGALSFSTTMVLLAICILMQSAVNTFNDYYDYAKGLDSAEDDVDPTDAVLVYNNVNPRSARNFAIGCVVAAFALGAYIIYLSGIVPLLIGIVGAVFVVGYSAGKTPISHLPLGEAVSGIVMGGLIPFACYCVSTGQLDFGVWGLSVPLIIGIGLIMMTNNTCDIDKDREVQRRTLPVLLGRSRARTTYHALVAVWIAFVCVIVIWLYPAGTIILPFMLLVAYPQLNALLKNPLAPHTRVAAMGQICSVNITLGAFYATALLVGSSVTVVL